MIQVAVFGYGTVGSGVVEVLQTNQDMIDKKSEEQVRLKYVLDLRDFPEDPIQKYIVHDVDVILNDPEVNIICETMGGLKVAYDYTKRALEAGKSVCTSNKELVAAYGPELIKIAKEHKCNYLFEASVGGGIPIIRPLNNSLSSEKIDGITGILNGTTNYILTKMAREGSSFETVLKEAQELGYAERNPEADVEGHDAGRKIAILSSLMYGKNVKYENVYMEGITKITFEDFAYAKAMNHSIKLLATSKDEDGKSYAMVAPFMISENYPLYSVNDVFNGIYVHSNMLGDSMYYGRGAGKLPTASAVIADVVDCARHMGKNITCFWDAEEKELCGIDDVEFTYFVRVKNEAAAQVKEVFGDVKEIRVSNVEGEFGFITEKMMEKDFKAKAAQLDGMISRIRMEK